MRRRSRSLTSLVAIGAIVAALGVVAMPMSPALAATVGTGDCASEVGGGMATIFSDIELDSPTGQGTAKVCRIGFESGSGTWTVPTGVTSVWLEMLGGGGGGGNFGGGGGGEMVLRDLGQQKAVTVVPGTQMDVAIGVGGTGGNHRSAATNGGDTIFGSITANGGGAGGSYDPNTGIGTPGNDGGNGGGGAPSIGASLNTTYGADGGVSTATNGIAGTTGGAGVGVQSTYNGSNAPLGSPNRYLAGGGGGGSGGTNPLAPGTDGKARDWIVGTPGNGGTIQAGRSGWGQGMTYALDFLSWHNGMDKYTLMSPIGGLGSGGSGGVASIGTDIDYVVVSPPDSSTSPNTAGLGFYDRQPTNPGIALPNTGAGGGGAGATPTDARVGGDGGSGLVILLWLPGGAAAGSPSAPTNVNGNPGTGSADVTWTPPSDDGGSAITSYGVESSTDGGSTWSAASMCTGVATTCTVTGLTDGSGYIFHVSATNANGTSAWSDPSGTVTPGTGPRFTG